MTEKEIDFEKISFEEAIVMLENIVRELESGRIKLDEAVSSYEKAVKLKTFCEKRLKEAQLKIEKIEISPNGELKTSEFSAE